VRVCGKAPMLFHMCILHIAGVFIRLENLYHMPVDVTLSAHHSTTGLLLNVTINLPQYPVDLQAGRTTDPDYLLPRRYGYLYWEQHQMLSNR